MFGVLVLVLAALAFLVVFVGLLATLARLSNPPIEAAPVLDLLRSARTRALVAVGIACLAVAALFTVAATLPDLVGLPYLLAPGIAGALGLGAYAAAPPRVPGPGPGSTTEAFLTRRTPASFLSRGTRIALVLAVVAQFTVVFTGLTGSADERGRLREIAFRSGGLASTSGPYGGWFYAGPLLALDVVFLLVLLLALRRIAATPALGRAEYAEVDSAWRRASCRIVVALGVAALLLPGGALTLVSGIAAGNDWFPGIARWWAVAARVLLVGGIVMVVGSVVALAASIAWALALPRTVTTDVGRRSAPAAGGTR